MNVRGTLLLIAAVLALGVSVNSQDNPTLGAAPNSTPARGPEINPDYTIGPDDILDVYIVDVPELSRSYRVTSRGTVILPLLSTPIPAAGSTLPQFSQSLAAELQRSGLVSQAQVTTSVQHSHLHSVAITGAVRKPQIYPLFVPSTLMDVLTQAEGLAEDASSTAIIYRGDVAVQALGQNVDAETAEAGRTTTVDLRRALDSGDRGANVTVYPGDRVVIPRAGIVYVVGAVNRPGGFPMKSSQQAITVLQAIALAQDIKSTAIPSQTLIFRRDSTSADGRRQIPVDLKRLLSGKAKDPALQADDILFVPDSSSKRALHRGIEAVLQTASGIAIFRH
jgi:polysaccharide export outer membrane protein